jgi:hypothetical protein
MTDNTAVNSQITDAITQTNVKVVANPLRTLSAHLTTPPATPSTDAFNNQEVQAVPFTNSEPAAYAANQVAVAPKMMITQAGGLVTQSAANYFDGASKSVRLKNIIKNGA